MSLVAVASACGAGPDSSTENGEGAASSAGEATWTNAAPMSFADAEHVGVSAAPGPAPTETEPAESVGSQQQALTSNGCSAEPYVTAIQQILHPLPTSPKTLFRTACDTHDYCYSSGKSFYGYSRASCDKTFGNDLMAICSRSYFDPLLLSACQLAATEFTTAVRFLAESHYMGTPCQYGQVNAPDCSTYEPFYTNPPISTDYLLFTTTAGTTYRVLGAPNSGSSVLPGTATALSAYAFRGGYIAGGTINLIEGDPSIAKTIYTPGAASFKVSGNRVGAIFANNGFWLQEGALLGGWTSGLMAHLFDLDQDRVVAATRGAKYSVWLKKGPVSAAWKEILTSPSEEIQQLSVVGTRIAVTRTYKLLTTEDDGATWNTAPFAWVDNTQTKMAGTRLGVVVPGNVGWDLMVTENPKGMSYTRIASNIKSWDTTASRLAVIRDGHLWLQDGGFGGSWRDVGTAQSVKVSGNRVAFTDGGKLYVKDGPVMDSWTTRANWTHVASGVKDYAIWQKGDYNSRDYVNVIQ